MIKVTLLAAEKIKEFFEKNGLANPYLRVEVQRVWVQNEKYELKYKLRVEENKQDEDMEYRSHGIRIIIDSISKLFLKNILIGWESNGRTDGFIIEDKCSR